MIGTTTAQIPLSWLRNASDAEIGRYLLPLLAKRPEYGTSLTSFCRNLAEQYPANCDEAATLFSEGASFLVRVGYVVENPMQLGAPFFQLSRAGRLAAESGEVETTTALHSEAEKLLHPKIAAECIPELERRPPDYDSAVLKAFKSVEIATRDAAGLPSTSSGLRDVFNKAFGAPERGKRGVLTPEPMTSSEAIGLRDLFAGAHGALRNPVGHRVVGHEAEQTLRLLIFASAQLYILDELAQALTNNV